MIVKVQISKTWQEKQFEPFNVQLGVEVETGRDMADVSETELRATMKELADELQQTAKEIFERRHS